ncbi:hypothetical protein M9Y10_008327 [Tritrichomonas musculus]|uniref:EamA domain-containing protein n=1 Tax=Tritrichomonas musculus TaxID=1915356 RepID=A0ABR2J071_9EUKA
MKFTVIDAVVYIFLALVYGTAFAAVQQGQKYFNSCVLIAYRMLFGFGICFIIFWFRFFLQPGYKQIARAHFQSGFLPILHLAIGGILFHGVMQCMAAIAVQWLPSAAAQITQPISTATAAIISHFVLPDEPFTLFKFFSLISALIGVILNAVPSFLHASSPNETKNVSIGYVIIFVAVIAQGVGMVYMKWKTPNTDVTIAAMIQVGASAILCFAFSLIYDKPRTLQRQTIHNKPMGWLWALIIGVLATGIAGHGYVFLVNHIGATGASFIVFGQIFVGIVVGVVFCHEWRGYRWWEILMCIIGVLFIAGAIGFGFIQRKPKDIGSELSDLDKNSTKEESADKKKKKDKGQEKIITKDQEAHYSHSDLADHEIAEL